MENIFLGSAIIIILVIFIITLGTSILTIVGKWKMYIKAGRNGWEAIVPYYSMWILCEIAELKWWFFLIMYSGNLVMILGLSFLIPVASLAAITALFFCNYNIALKFEKDPIGYGIGMTLLPVVFYPLLGLGNAKFNSKVKVSPYGVIKPNEDSSNEKSQNKSEVHSSTFNFCKNCGAKIEGGKYCSSCGTEIR